MGLLRLDTLIHPGANAMTRKWRLAIAVLLSSWLVVASLAHADPVQIAPVQVASTDDTATIRGAVLAEPLVATSPTSAGEDRQLATTLLLHERRQDPDDLRLLEDFAARHPDSGWTAAVLTNLGISYLHQGYFSKALDAWRSAWRLGRSSTLQPGKALVDRAVSELALLQASLGRMAELAALFDEIGSRPITGSATEKVQAAREMLALVDKADHHLFICGPLALQALMLAKGATADRVAFLQWYRAKSQGTNLAQLADLADKAKLGYRLVFVQRGGETPVPSVMHLKVGHFAAVVGEADGRLHLEDAAVQSRHLWMRKGAVAVETRG
jgi:hypothetical protein